MRVTIVKVKLRESFEQTGESGCEPLEFEVDSAASTLQDGDVTINWKANEIQSQGVFYTDSNGLGIVKRSIKRPNDGDSEIKSFAPSNYYPINTAIFIDNHD